MAFAHGAAREEDTRTTDASAPRAASAAEPAAEPDRALRSEQALRAFVSDHPTACLIGSVLLGFVAARLLRAGDSS